MSESDARLRIFAQSPQEEKIGLAHVVIRNDGSLEDTWKQVMAAWQKHLPGVDIGSFIPRRDGASQLTVQRGRPRQADEIAEFINLHRTGKRSLSRENIIAQFSEKAFLLLYQAEKLVGVAGWQVENLVSRTSDIYLDSSISYADGLRAIIVEVERASKELQCEASLIFLPKVIARKHDIWRGIGYEERAIESLMVRAWEEAAIESMPPGSIMLFRQLRKDRVLRPV